MTRVDIAVDSAGHFNPEQPITGSIVWSGGERRGTIEVRLEWFTSGWGDRDGEVRARTEISFCTDSGDTPFRFEGIAHPWSFSGKLVSLQWRIVAVPPVGVEIWAPIVIGPNRTEFNLYGSYSPRESNAGPEQPVSK